VKRRDGSCLDEIILSCVSFLVIIEKVRNRFFPPCTQVVK
jgi:hypothetical protein